MKKVLVYFMTLHVGVIYTGKKIGFKELRVVKKLLRLNRYVGKLLQLKILFMPVLFTRRLLVTSVTVHAWGAVHIIYCSRACAIRMNSEH
jgi:hypothetical protein